jgi:hypothetical protein
MQDIQAQLQIIQEKLADLPTSYSQSNPGIVLAYRELNRRKAKLEALLKK